jgi:2-amino-4-hydroxy-6-hydroxymethyldihydropteridine diphosphokinase
MHERAFVLLPLKDLQPDWQHPKLKVSVSELIARLPEDQIIRPLTQE